MMHRTLLAITVIVAISIPALVVRSQEDEKSAIDMRKKLTYSQNILDGLVTEDFDKILQAANSMNGLARHKWAENDSAAYRTQNQVFWFTTGTLVMAAEKKNIDSATLAYTQMTHSCINCHKLIRRQ